MKRTYKSMMGVTLLEIMLVLVVAALVIVMSIRFYQSASLNSKVNSALSVVQAVMGAGENYFNANNSSYLNVTGTALGAYLPGGVMPQSPWGGVVTVGTATATTLTFTVPVSQASDCSALLPLVKANAKMAASTCDAGGLVANVTQ